MFRPLWLLWGPKSSTKLPVCTFALLATACTAPIPLERSLPLCCPQARTQEARLQEMLALRQRHADKVAEQIGRVVSDVKQVGGQGAREWAGMSVTE